MSARGGGERFDRRVEVLAALLLSLATVLTAWCSYQAARWDNEQSARTARAAAGRVEAAKLENQAVVLAAVQAGLFTQYLVAGSLGDQALAGALYARFPPELQTATAAWQARASATDAPPPASPFEMPEYRLPAQAQAQRLQEQVARNTAAAGEADAHADRYVLLTVVCATAIFFGGISGKFRWRLVDAATLAAGGEQHQGAGGVALTLASR